MSRDPLLFLEDIVEACDTIRAYLDGVEYESLLGDPMRLDAVVRNLAIVGEAAGRLSGDVREAIPDVPWSQVIAMRNTLIHGYFGIGLAGAIAASTGLERLLFGVTPTDPVTYVVVGAVLVAGAALASLLAARHATRIDPIVALRCE